MPSSATQYQIGLTLTIFSSITKIPAYPASDQPIAATQHLRAAAYAIR
jgi:hypothetical protein